MDEVRGIDAMDFDEIAEVQGWNADSCLAVVRAFISEAGQSEMLAEYARRVAETENAEHGTYRYNAHTNDLGDWCPYSLTRATVQEAEAEDERCPQGCRGSFIEDDPDAKE